MKTSGRIIVGIAIAVAYIVVVLVAMRHKTENEHPRDPVFRVSPAQTNSNGGMWTTLMRSITNEYGEELHITETNAAFPKATLWMFSTAESFDHLKRRYLVSTNSIEREAGLIWQTNGSVLDHLRWERTNRDNARVTQSKGITNK